MPKEIFSIGKAPYFSIGRSKYLQLCRQSWKLKPESNKKWAWGHKSPQAHSLLAVLAIIFSAALH
ncbi:hypothetical protein [Undibacterium sp. TJN19]|uniref:hypothetical protein n=1 Tax=Undibacterium sp. TJN19 TaxID=3413055 RepID=UPI003BF3E21C